MSGAYQGQIGVDVGLGSLRGHVPVGMLAVESPLGMGLHGLGDVCSTMTTAGTIGGALTSIWAALGLATSGETGGTMRQVGRTASAGSAAFDAAVGGACTPATTTGPGSVGGDFYASEMARVRAERELAKQAALDVEKQKTNRMLLIGGGIALAAAVGAAFYFSRRK